MTSHSKPEELSIELSALDCIEGMLRVAESAGLSMTKAIRKYRKGKLRGTILESEFDSMLFLLEGQKDHRR